jgi:hypothetical protein
MNPISEYRNHAARCLRLAESSNERDRRALFQMAADWHALADKVREREAEIREQEPAPVLPSPSSPEPTGSSPTSPEATEPALKRKPFRPKHFQKKAPTVVRTIFLKSK